MRRRGPKTRTIAFNELFNADQRARLDRFWEEDLDHGTHPFLYRDPHADGFSLWTDDAGVTLQDEAGNDLIIEGWLLCTFSTNEPVWSARGGGWFQPRFELVELP
jgi:hypothetical protein